MALDGGRFRHMGGVRRVVGGVGMRVVDFVVSRMGIGVIATTTRVGWCQTVGGGRGPGVAREFHPHFFFEKFGGDFVEGARRNLSGGNAQFLGPGQHGSVVQAQLLGYLVNANGHTAFLLKFDRPATAFIAEYSGAD